MRGRILMLLLVCLVVLGCAGTPKKSGFLDSYARMSPQYDLDMVRVSKQANLTPYDTLLLEPINTAYLGVSSVQGEDRKQIIEKLEENFRKEMSAYFRTVTMKENQISDPAKTVRLEVAVTELVPTDVVKNLVWGFGVGNATAGMEGRFVDIATGRELAAFSDRKKGSPFTKKEFDAQTKFPNWSKLRYLYVFTQTWPENVSKIVNSMKK